MQTFYAQLEFSKPFHFKDNPWGKPEIPEQYDKLTLSSVEFSIPGISLGLITEEATINQLKLEVAASPENTASLQGIIQGPFTLKDGLDIEITPDKRIITALGMTLDFILPLEGYEKYYRDNFYHNLDHPPADVTLIIVTNPEDLPKV